MKKGDCIKFEDMRNANIFANAARAVDQAKNTVQTIRLTN